MKDLHDRIRALSRYALGFGLTLSVWCLSVGTALARPREEIDQPVTKSWVMPYILVVVCIAFGLIVVCRPTTRKTEVQIKEDDDED